MRTLLILLFTCVSLAATTAEAQRFRGTVYGRGYGVRGIGHHAHRHIGHHYGRHLYRRSVGFGHHYRHSYSHFRAPIYRSRFAYRSYFYAPRYVVPNFYVAPRVFAPLYDPYCSPYSAYGYSNWLYAAAAPRTTVGYLAGASIPSVSRPYLASTPSVSRPYLASTPSVSRPYLASAPVARPVAAPATTPTAPLRAVDALFDRPTSTELVSRKIRSTKMTNLQARTLARSFLATGDRLFKQQRYHDALQKYKSATKAASDLPEAHFRQGHAYIATNRYEQAAYSFKIATALASDIDRGGFSLNDLYADSPISKSAHLDALAEETLEDDSNSDLLFLVGVFLYYDGQADRADRFFDEAARVSRTSLRHLAKFRGPVAPDSDSLLGDDSFVTASLPSEVGR